MGLGVVMIFSATQSSADGIRVTPLVIRHLAYLGIGTCCLFLFAFTDYRGLSSLAYPLYGIGLLALVIVLLLGRMQFGSTRWINLFDLIQIQPSEPVKLATILALARFFSTHRDSIHRPRTIALSLAIAGVPAFLVVVEPDLGTSLVYWAIWAGLAFIAGVPLRYFLILGVGAAGLARLIWPAVPKYMQDRLTIFLDPEADPTGQGYNIIQAAISVGSGGLFGRGFLSGTQSQLEFLRVRYADFIFSVLAEELGFIGAGVLFALVTIVVVRGLRAAALASEPFGRLITVGIVTMLLFQFLVNVGMNVRLLPVTGIPLPLISYGGSSLITFLAGIGLVQSITMRHQKLDF